MKLLFSFLFISLLLSEISQALPLRPAQFTHALNVSLMFSKNIAATTASDEESTSASGISSEYVFLHANKRLWSLKSDFLMESASSGEGGYSMNIYRNSLAEWGILAFNFTSNCRCSLGLGLGLGLSQIQTNSSIEGSSASATGQLEPFWGWMADGKLLATDEVFVEMMIRKTYSNNFSEGNRLEITTAIGLSFF